MFQVRLSESINTGSAPRYRIGLAERRRSASSRKLHRLIGRPAAEGRDESRPYRSPARHTACPAFAKIPLQTRPGLARLSRPNCWSGLPAHKRVPRRLNAELTTRYASWSWRGGNSPGDFRESYRFLTPRLGAVGRQIRPDRISAYNPGQYSIKLRSEAVKTVL